MTAYIHHWGPYRYTHEPGVVAASRLYRAIIMMSQNRLAEKDRIEAHNDYMVNQKAEEEVRVILEHLDAQNEALEKIHQMLLEKSMRG